MTATSEQALIKEWGQHGEVVEYHARYHIKNPTFCRECLYYKSCKARLWHACPFRLKYMREVKKYMGGKKRKVFIVGSTCYKDKMSKYAEELAKNGFEPILPTFDDDKLTIIEVLLENRQKMWEADEVRAFYDGRSIGTAVDFGMALMASKPFKLVYLNDKTLVEGMKAYELISEKMEEKKE